MLSKNTPEDDSVKSLEIVALLQMQCEQYSVVVTSS